MSGDVGGCHGRHALCSVHAAFSSLPFVLQHQTKHVMPIFSTVLSTVSLQLLAVVAAATLIHPYSLCVAASTPTHPVLAHGRSSLGQCWLSKKSDALTYIHLLVGGPASCNRVGYTWYWVNVCIMTLQVTRALFLHCMPPSLPLQASWSSPLTSLLLPWPPSTPH